MRFPTRRIVLPLVALALAGALPALAGCGQSGPLYLPPPKPKQRPAARPAPPATVPAPGSATR